MTTNDYRHSAVAKTANGMDSPYYKKTTIYATRLEVAEALGIRPETVSRWTSAGLIPVIRLGRLVRYDLAATPNTKNTLSVSSNKCRKVKE